MLRTVASALIIVLAVSACTTTGGSSSASLTPQQRALRDQSSRWQKTALTGAVLGAVGGAAVGAAAYKRDRGMGALVGLGVGLVAGLAAGVFTANRNLDFERAELGRTNRIDAAQQIASNLNQTADTSARVTQDNLRQLADLDRRYRSGQITASQYRNATASMKSDVELMRKTAKEAKDARSRLVTAGSDVPQLMTVEPRIEVAQNRLESSAYDLEEALRRVPAG